MEVEMFNLLLLIAASIGPGLLWLWYFYRLDRNEPEPLRLIFKVFFGGILLVIPAGILEHFWRPQISLALREGDWRTFLIMAFLGVALVEEGLKSGFLWWLVGRNRELDEPVDGVIYGITLGLGFASLENFLWASMFGFGVAAMRAVVTTLAHASFSGWMGYYLARYKLEKPQRIALLGTGFLVAWATHGAYDFLLFIRSSVSSILAFLLVGLILLRLFQAIRRLVENSPFRGE
jgi:RsiW-degrading membrane proteinase PrsW (M82 family)